MHRKAIRVWAQVVYTLFLIGCQPEAVVEVGYQPPVVPVRIAVNTRGEVSAGFSGEVNTPIGTFDIGGGVSVNAIQNQYSGKVLIVRVDDEVSVYNLEEGKAFNVTFDDSNTLYKKVALDYKTNGDIVLELESVQSGFAPQAASSIQQNNTNKYWCDDLQGIHLAVGDNARIVWPKVNLRSSPIVPQDYYANITTELEEGTSVKIIGGPECAHEGTWWEIRTEYGDTGWVREFISDGYLMRP